MPHESVLNSLASRFDPLVPGWDESDPDICQSTSFSAQHDLPDLSDWPGAPWSEATLAALDIETRRIVDEAAASGAGVVLANCGVMDAMAATLVDVETLQWEPLDRLLAAVAQPEGPAMTLVAS